MSRFVIIDGNAIVHRAFHALPPMTNKEGLVLNAVYGFASILLRAIKELRPDYLAVTFDLAGPTFRHEEYKEYKARRQKQPQELYDQLFLVKDLLKAMGIPIFEKEGYEADDVIATLATESQAENIIVTGDMDTLQLINNHTRVHTLKKGVKDVAVYDEAAVKERFGFEPEQVIDYKALAGDPSDNIIGVKGIGEKTAKDLIKKFGSVEGLYRVLKDKEQAKRHKISEATFEKLIRGREEAILSKRLVTLIKNVPLDFELEKCRERDWLNEKVKEILTRWEFGSLLKRMEKTQGDAEREKIAGQKQKQEIKIIEVKDDEGMEKMKKEIKRARRLAICLSDDGKAGLAARLFGLALTFDGAAVYYIPITSFCRCQKPNRDKVAETCLCSDCQGLLVFSQSDVALIGHDLKRALEIFKKYNLEVSSNLFFDVMIMDYLLDPGTRSHELSNLALRYLKKEAGQGSQASLFGTEIKILAEKTVDLWLIGEKLENELSDKGFLNLYKKIEMPLLPVLERMEEAGIKIDLDCLKELDKELKSKEKTVRNKIFKLAGQEFNIASPVQLKEVLFEKLAISQSGIRRGKTGLSTAAAELEKMRRLHPIIDLIFDYRETTKLQNTYVEVLPNLINSRDKRVHTTFNQAVTATGRLSSSNPNLQNIPVRSEIGRAIRSCFISEEGFKLVSLDYSQIELRVIASLANDREMIKIFENGEDIHVMTAAKIRGLDPSEVTAAMRSSAKAVNFGIIYGMGPRSLAEGSDISFAEAKDFIGKYFSVFREVKKFLDETKAVAHSLGYVETLLGRRRYLPEIHSTMPQLKNTAERMAVNAPIQGTAADLIKMAMIEIENKIINPPPDRSADKGPKNGDRSIKMLLQVHDELVFEVKEREVRKFVEEAREIMENVLKLRVPIKVDAKVGRNWGEMKEII